MASSASLRLLLLASAALLLGPWRPLGCWTSLPCAEGRYLPRRLRRVVLRATSASKPDAGYSAKYAGAILANSPAQFLDVLAAQPGSCECARRALKNVPERVAQDLLLRCLEQLPLRPRDAALAPILARLRPNPEAEGAATKQRALTAALALAELDAAAGLKVLQQWGVREADATLEQQAAVRQLAGKLPSQGDEEEASVLSEAEIGALAEIDSLVTKGELRQAAELAQLHGWNDRAKELYASSRSAKIRKALQDGKAIKIITFAGRKEASKRAFLEAALAEGMLDLARDRALAWRQPLAFGEEAERLAEERRARHFCLPADVEIHSIDDKAALSDVLRSLLEAPAVGLDVECSMFGEPALLQLSTREHAFLLDLLKLGSSPAFGAFMAKLLKDKGTKKLSFGGSGDLKVLAKLKGLRPADIRNCEPWVDLQQAKPGGLSRLTEEVLGRPLDKAMQASDWTSRPLNPAQMHYAALDAWVLTELHERQQR